MRASYDPRGMGTSRGAGRSILLEETLDDFFVYFLEALHFLVAFFYLYHVLSLGFHVLLNYDIDYLFFHCDMNFEIDCLFFHCDNGKTFHVYDVFHHSVNDFLLLLQLY